MLNIGLCLFPDSRLVSDGALELALLMSRWFPPWTGAHEEDPEETLCCWDHEQASISQRCRLQSSQAGLLLRRRPYITQKQLAEDSPKYPVSRAPYSDTDGPSVETPLYCRVQPSI